MAHDAKVSCDDGWDCEAQRHDRKRNDAASDGRDAAGSRSKDGDDRKPVALDELDEVVGPDANTPPDEVEEQARDHDPDQSSVAQNELFDPGRLLGDDWRRWRLWYFNY